MTAAADRVVSRAGAAGPPPETTGRPPRVLLLGHFGAGNLGNDASLSAVAGMLRRAVPGVQLVAACRKPDVVEQQTGLDARWIHAPRPAADRVPAGRLGRLTRSAYRLADVRHAVRTVGDADLVVVPGTGILDDFGGSRAYGWPAVLLTWFAAARLHRVPVAMIGIGAGPIASPSSRRVARTIARLASYQSYRDPGSRSFMVGLGVAPDEATLSADVVFGSDLDAVQLPPAPTGDDRPLAVVAVMDYRGWRPTGRSAYIRERYLADLTGLTCRLLSHGYRVRLLTADQTGDDDATLELADLVRAAAPDLAGTGLTTAAAVDFPDAVRLTGDARFVVATRYHSVVAALRGAVPVLSLGYARKNDELLARVGLGDFAQDVEKVDSELLVRQLDRLERERDELAARVRSGLAAMRADLDAQADVLAALVARRTARRQA